MNWNTYRGTKMTTTEKILEMLSEDDRILAEMNQKIEQIEQHQIAFLYLIHGLRR